MGPQESELEALEHILTDTSAMPVKLSYAVLKSITNNFSDEIGHGGFGVVYQGVVKKQKVAVKKLIISESFSDELFLKEVNCLISAKHKNIVRFLGYCSETQGELIKLDNRYVIAEVWHKLLCFEYVPNRSLDRYLKEKRREGDWIVRYEMIKGICHGLGYLHDNHINHLDLKPENVLLDAYLDPKLTDFGLSRFFDEKQSRIFTQNICGTMGYIAPEFIDMGEISYKTDIFSLGILIIKLLTGCNEYDAEKWHESLDEDYPQMKICIEIAKCCVDRDQHARPTIEEIIQKLEIETTDNIFEEKQEVFLYIPYNILPLDAQNINQTVACYPEIQGTVYALQNTKGLQWGMEHKEPDDKGTGKDLFDWLQVMFGFQIDNVSNQREHLILLLANIDVRQAPRSDQEHKLDDRALDAVMKMTFKNYKKWCKYLGRKNNLWLPTLQLEVQQYKLLYIGLFLLIWGEAANLRFIPECLCYIFHHMAFELYGMLAGHVNPVTGENVKPAYGGDKEAFLTKIVTPIYEVIKKEAARSKTIKSKHPYWRNYDDLNEYFWSNDCFELGWPMRADADFFKTPDDVYAANNHSYGKNKSVSNVHCVGKVNFVEIRSFWQIFRSYYRVWIFLVLSLQAMLIIAWNGDTLGDVFDPEVFKKVLSIFITAAIMNMGQAFLELLFMWRARRRLSFAIKLRYDLKLVSAAAWVLILPVIYAHTVDIPPSLGTMIKRLLGDGQNQSLLYILSVFLYMAPNLLAATLFVFPWLGRVLESSDVKLITIMMWWCEPRLFVGRQMHERGLSRLKYTIFWVLLLAMKFTVNFYTQIRPLVQLTKDIAKGPIRTTEGHGSFPYAKNSSFLITLWAPIILVYFMDTQIWFVLFSTSIGGIYGYYRRIGEIQTIGMLRSRFEDLLWAFSVRLIPSKANNSEAFGPTSSSKPMDSDDERRGRQKIAGSFAQMWNLIITSFREEDLVSDREMGLLLFSQFAEPELDIIQWPPFLLASKIPTALNMAAESGGNDHDLKERMEHDHYFSYAVRECYILFKSVISTLVFGQREQKVVQEILKFVEKLIEEGNLVKNLNMRNLPHLSIKFLQLLEILKNNKEDDIPQVVFLLQDMLEVVSVDLIGDQYQFKRLWNLIDNVIVSTPLSIEDQLFSKGTKYPVEESNGWTEKIKRLYLLLTMNESATDLPTNHEAKRRLLFFANSLFMEMPGAPKVQTMLPFSVLTTSVDEDALLSSQSLMELINDRISTLFYLKRTYPDEWKNFLERVQCRNDEELHGHETLKEDIRFWASYRMQTLARTVRGMMYYRRALEFEAFLDMTKYDDLTDGYTKNDSNLSTRCKATADMKFTFVLSCQKYGFYKRSGHQCAYDILRLMQMYPSMRVAYVDEVEQFCQDERKKIETCYYSCLVKVSETNHFGAHEKNTFLLDQVIYRIKLPGNPILGEEIPENQNQAVIFTRGECLQTTSTNQDHYIEEALKMRNLLQEFLNKHDGVRHPSILGVREHIFTGSVSSLGWLMSNMETSFVTIEQRVLDNPLRVRFHYDHPDIFNRLFHITRGGTSKASECINYSGGIFAGFNATLREGIITHHEYMQLGTGIDVGLNQRTLYEANIALGRGEQTLSRDMNRLGNHYDFFRMLSCYYTTIGSYFSTLITVWTIYVFLYGRLYLVLTGFDEALKSTISILVHSSPLQTALALESFVCLGFLMAIPMIIEIGLEKGFIKASFDFVLMHLQLASVFFAFSLGTKAHYYGKTLIHGGTGYRATGRGFDVSHAKFADNYRLYSRSHFVKGLELMILLVFNEIFGPPYLQATTYVLIKLSMWLMVCSWLFAPFLFNPSGFDWHKIMDDWSDWNRWISKPGGAGVAPEKSWESWWEKEQATFQENGKFGTCVEILLALRFFVYQYGLIYNLKMAKHTRRMMVDGLSMVVIFVFLLIMKTKSSVRGRRRFHAKLSQLVFPWIKLFAALRFVYVLVILIGMSDITVISISSSILGFLPTGWGLLLIARPFKPAFERMGLWGNIKAVARSYDTGMGLLLFAPVAFLAWFPCVSEFQTRMLFSPAVCRGLSISRILRGYKEDMS